jgi:hypothetical protein
MLGTARLQLAVEEHGAGRQLLRFRIRPRLTRGAVLLSLTVAAVAASGGLYGAWTAFAALAAVGAVVALRALAETALSTAALLRGIRRQEDLADHHLQVDLERQLLAHATRNGLADQGAHESTAELTLTR